MVSLLARISSRRSFRKIAWITAVVVVPAFVTSLAVAFSSDLSAFNNRYGTSNTQLNTCTTCHSPNSTNASQLNPYGRALMDLRATGSSITQAMAAIENDDSDGDGETNIVEINNATFPGDPTSNSGGTPPPPAISVESFTLINADTDQPIATYNPLTGGTTLDLATLSTQNLNIRANTNPATVGSVIFDYDGTSSFRVDSAAPYALASESNGNYNAMTLTVGSHTVTATPYDAASGGGTAGTALTLNFNVTDSGGTPPPPTGSDFYVSTTGNDSNSGTQSSPWRTIQHAADVLQPGETVHVADGTYTGFHSTRSGSATSPITFMADGSNVLLNQRNNSTQDIINIEGHDGIIIDGFVIRNSPRVGVRAVECNDVIIRNNDIQNSSLDAILTGFAVRVQILNNICGNSSAEHGIYVSNSHGANDNPIIRGNFCFGNGRSGIQLNGDCFTGPGDGTIDNAIVEDNIITNNSAKGISLISAANYRVANNILYDNAAGAAGIHCTDEPGCGNPSSGVIVNNTIAESRIACIRITDNSTNNTIFNNICVGGEQIADEVGASNIDATSNILQSSAGTLFVDPANRDYHLSSSAAAINVGKASFGGFNAPTTDADGAARPVGGAYDAGAYESGASGPPPPPPPPPPPTSISVESFTLINADTDLPIAAFDPLVEGTTLDLSTLPTQNLNIRANTNPATVGSVVFDYDGTSAFAVESLTPYALASDTGGDYHAMTFTVGSHVVTATPFDASSGGGTAGTALTLNFSVTNGGGPPPPPPTQPPAPPQGVTATETSPGCVTVTWQPNGESDLAGYTLHWGPVSVEQGQATSYASSMDVGTSTSQQICNLSGTQFFAVRAYNTNNDFSAFSAERSVTVQTADVTAPIVINRNPGSNATGIAVNSSVAFSVTDVGVGVDNTAIVVTIAGNPPDNVTMTGNPARYDVVCEVNGNFPSNTTIDVSVQVSDLASPPNTRTSNWSFTTSASGGSDTTPPVVSNESPVGGSQNIATTSSVSVDVSDAGTGVDLSGVQFFINNVQVPFTWSGGPASATLTYSNQTGFSPNSTVTVRVDVCDLSAPPNCTSYQFSFDTGSGAPAPPPSSNKVGAIAPNGYWKDDPNRPLEVQNMPAGWTVRIFNTVGAEIRRFTNNSGDGFSWSWDFTNDRGQRVAGGLYLIRVLDSGGGLRQTGRFIVQ